MKSHKSRSLAPPSASTQARGRGSATAASNAEMQDRLSESEAGRPTNLTFRFKGSALQQVALTPELADSMRALHTEKMEHTKDGMDLTDSEKLYFLVEKLINAGITGGRLAHTVEAVFFAGGSVSSDRVSKVTLSGGEVRVEFTSGSGLHFVQGAIEPVIGTAPTRYQGRDTNARGAQVTAVQTVENLDKLPRQGTFLVRNAAAVEALFLAGNQGGPYARQTDAERAANPAYRMALREFEHSLMVDYLTSVTEACKQSLGTVAGRRPDELTSTALQFAMQYTNANLAASSHSSIELQDEAIVQRALSELGVEVDVDTDTGTATR